ncbi:Meiotic recombination protein rec8 [Ophiocordyceps camponoti-floridani]|uniref:Meiotic recombination protein rec8 n=1 Tax=Ophiocordyceps camponoti-floridani TaxID=2030778 RepID=A0A8H4VGS9_9HYPO|nr:Meiotic recombination protein rec8 [Ophiocordyceps camponoti-floridani]
MFYSHEILSNSQYGVATVWLAATVAASKGGGALRRLTKKAVQEVNVPKACETIINPGAPLALRLQGSLLYGVSRVFSEQCRYVLSDAEKTQSDMMTFFRLVQTNETDPEAGKTKRHLIMLQDDPGFDLFSTLPNLDSLLASQHIVGIPSQGSSNNFSFMTPGGGLSQVSLSSGREDFAPLSLGLQSSSSRADAYQLPLQLGNRSSPLAKHGPQQQDGQNMPEFQPFAVDDELEHVSGIGLDFDGQGNLIGFIEPELPPPPVEDERVDVVGTEERLLQSVGEEQVLSLGDAPVARPTMDKGSEGDASYITVATSAQASAENRRGPGRPRRVVTMLDDADHISRNEFRGWTDNYVDNMKASRKNLHKKTTTTTTAQARKRAYALMYGNRIAGIGLPTGLLGIPHPLASDFAGPALEANLRPEGSSEKRGRRRTSTEAFSQGGEEDERRVRQKPHGDAAELGRDNGPLEDPPTPEMGMEPAHPLSERRSSSMMPWSRAPSAARSLPKVTPSPLHGRGSAIASIERRDDDMEIDQGSPLAPIDFSPEQQASGPLDHATQAFLTYAAKQAADQEHRVRDGRRWLEFDDIAGPETHDRSVAAQAFLHVLSLATKGVVRVEQEGVERGEAFGVIRVGFAAPESESVI